MALSPEAEKAIQGAYQRAVARILKSDKNYQQNQANFSALLGKIQNVMKISLPEFAKLAHTDYGTDIFLSAFQACREDGSLDFEVPVDPNAPKPYTLQNPFQGQGKRSAKEILSNREDNNPDAANTKIAANVQENIDFLTMCAENKRKVESGEWKPEPLPLLPPHNVPESDAGVQAFYANARTTAEQIRQWRKIRKNYVASGAPDEVVTG